MKRLNLRTVSVALGSLLLWSCTSASGGMQPPPGTAPGQSFARMYDGQCFSNAIFILGPPFSPSQQPAGEISQPCSNGFAFDPSSGVLAVASGATFGALSIRIYGPPYTSQSVPLDTFTPSALEHPRQVAWDGSGNVWVADDIANKVLRFDAPFSSSTQAAATNTLATEPAGLAIDSGARLMFIGDLGGSRLCAATPCHVFVVPAPYTGAASATLTFANSTPTALRIDNQGRLFVGFDNGDYKGLIKVYAPPFTTGEAPLYTLDAKGPLENLAFDPKQNLYAQLYLTGGVVVFNGPIEESRSAPSASLGCPAGAASCGLKNWAGLAFGP